MDDEQWSRDRTARAEEARLVAARLHAEGAAGVLLTWVDNAGLTRVKGVPVRRLEHAAAWGVGMSPIFDVFLVDDSITESRFIGGPGGDLRLFPDLDRAVPLAAQPGWAWAPVDRYTQDGTPHPGCQRRFARRMVDRALALGLEFRCAFEVEWVAARADGPPEEIAYPTRGPAYGMGRVIDLSDCLRDLLRALDEQGIAVHQVHPEYAPGQYELSVAPEDPVAAADTCVLVRQTVRAVSARHGLRVSFAPAVEAGGVGNGGHLHLSLWRGGSNLCHGGTGPHGLTGEAEAFLAGVLAELPALVAVGAPGPGSPLRLVPSHWAGAYRCWGRENREAALRLVTGSSGEEGSAANVEVKCFDGAANPYLAVGAVIAAGLAGLEAGRTLPPEAHGDPATWPPEQAARLGVERLPQSLPEAIGHFERSELLREAMGEVLHEAFRAVRQGEAELYADATPEEVAAATRWRY
ncbi:glutamine synthetase family protein [Peterkaempfera bronchialis]|uniref:Glutamine synthetase n=1 Tax=Peterkaempfera bronchialis TaxID=2126346 RepID=A0A345T1Z9_9ACTN|nr:glutamine synthetase family protein [Peterkaempfera bronchialis]AXI80004.1 glutamine synthetase [Peterkaempfera bronchialis]